MGEVFLAYDDRLDRLVAIKRMRPDALRDPSRRERLRREARAAARLSHPNVVQVYDLEEDEERGDSIVLEYVQGQTIAELLHAGPLPVEQAVELAGQVADGLAAAHAAGLVHRDLKAENVVVTAEGRAKILDFGLVKPLDPGADSTMTEQGAVLGTYRAMAPEQAEGVEVDARADLFSLGVLLYEMLTGRSPFQGATPVATLRNLTGAAPRPLSEVRPDLPGERGRSSRCCGAPRRQACPGLSLPWYPPPLRRSRGTRPRP
jgi:serine/threonine-protein kinase